MKRKTAIVILLAAIVCAFLAVRAAGAEALDEINVYRINVDVNRDGTLQMVYHIDWKVLNSDEGGVSWVHIGIPNNRCSSYTGLTSNIRSITLENNGGSVLRIDFDREYVKDEVISFEFTLVQDYMYEMNGRTEGETHYEFTPGWFDEIRVDSLEIAWNSAGALSASPANRQADGAFLWATSLEPGETFTVSVDYPNDAFGFDSSKRIINGGESQREGASPLTGLIMTAIFGLIVYAVVKKIVGVVSYNNTANMGAGGKKITHEKIVYFPACPGCGAPREEGKDSCQYCGKSLIKSRETVTEEQVPEEIKQKTANGTYHYGSDPNTFMRVHVVPVVVHTGSRGVSRSSGGGRSCACASHCACACACACAGGGRAGCSAKDFYNTGLKLTALKKAAKK